MTGQEPFRLAPRMPVSAYKTYAIQVPRATHTRVVSCREYGCEAYEHGWTTVLDVTVPKHREAATWIVSESGRRYTVTTSPEGPVTFTFPPGQECFRQHRVQSQPALYVVRDGDHRGNPTGRRQILSERAWVDDFGEHQNRLADHQRKG